MVTCFAGKLLTLILFLFAITFFKTLEDLK